LDLELIRIVDLTAALSSSGVPARRALALARNPAADSFACGLGLVYDRSAHLADLERRLLAAAERVVPRRRGRPPTR
jgi:hypothetical protein